MSTYAQWPEPDTYEGSSKARQEVGDPGHCEKCVSIGHVLAHPNLGCGDVGCNRHHHEPQDAAAQTSAVAPACSRCSRPVRWTGPGSPRARLLRRAKAPQGWCASCALTGFLRDTEPLATLLKADQSKLLDSRVQEHVARVLRAGQADADVSEIDWPDVVRHWSLPL